MSDTLYRICAEVPRQRRLATQCIAGAYDACTAVASSRLKWLSMIDLSVHTGSQERSNAKRYNINRPRLGRKSERYSVVCVRQGQIVPSLPCDARYTCISADKYIIYLLVSNLILLIYKSSVYITKYLSLI